MARTKKELKFYSAVKYGYLQKRDPKEKVKESLGQVTGIAATVSKMTNIYCRMWQPWALVSVSLH